VLYSGVLSDFAAPLQDLSCGPVGADTDFLVSDTGQIFKFSVSELCILV